MTETLAALVSNAAMALTWAALVAALAIEHHHRKELSR